MIRISDSTNLIPHLFSLNDLFELCHDEADIEIWPVAMDRDSLTKSNVFTIFVENECGISLNTTQYQIHHERRPNNVIAVTAINKQHPWPFKVIEFWSNIYFTYRNNSDPVALTIGQKPYDALALFGGYEPGRAKMFEALQHHDLVDKCLVNLQPKKYDKERWSVKERQQHRYYQSELIPKLDEQEFLQLAYSADGMFTMPTFTDNRYSYVSQKVPYRLFDQCYVSLVAETENFPLRDTIFLTEKIAKPLIAGHPFLLYAAPGTLKHLQDHGFKTFHDWIDESYDSIEDHDRRATAVVDSLNEFSKQSAENKFKIFTEMQETCKHNQSLATDVKFLCQPIAQTILENHANNLSK